MERFLHLADGSRILAVIYSKIFLKLLIFQENYSKQPSKVLYYLISNKIWSQLIENPNTTRTMPLTWAISNSWVEFCFTILMIKWTKAEITPIIYIFHLLKNVSSIGRSRKCNTDWVNYKQIIIQSDKYSWTDYHSVCSISTVLP